MYHAHFGLNARPFAETTDPSAFVSLPGHEAALRRLRYGLDGGAGVVSLVGPTGSGKTLLARRVALERGGPVVLLTFPLLSPAELLAFLADELGAAPDSAPGMAGSLRRVRAALEDSRGDRPLLIVDEAHLIPDPETFETFRLLLNFATDGPPDLGLILVGDRDVREKIPPALADRLAARGVLSPLTEAESATYVAGRLAIAGATTCPFGPEALSALHREAEGLPRRLNRLADLALLIAFARDRDEADADAVGLAARDAAFAPAA